MAKAYERDARALRQRAKELRRAEDTERAKAEEAGRLDVLEAGIQRLADTLTAAAVQPSAFLPPADPVLAELTRWMTT